MDVSTFEVLRLRAEELERNFYSLRTIEWLVYSQLFAGYAAIGGGYAVLHGPDFATRIDQKTLAVSTLAVLLVTLVIGLTLLVRVQSRVHFSRQMSLEYLKAIHSAAPGSLLPEPDELKRSKPLGGDGWCKYPMRALVVLFWFSVSIAVIAATRWYG